MRGAGSNHLAELVRRLPAGDVLALLGAVFESASDGVGVSGSDGVVRMVNPALLRLFGYGHEDEVLGRSVLDFISAGSRELMAEILRRQDHGGEVPPLYVCTAHRADGTAFSVEARTSYFEVHGEQYTFTILREVRPRPLSADAAHHGEELYRAIFEVNTAVKLLICPTSGRIVDANQAAVDFYGWPLEVLRTMRIQDINLLTDAEVKAEMEHARSGRRTYFRFRHRTASGDIRHVEVHSGPITVDGEQLLFSIIHDVTERNQLEEQLRRAQRLEAIGRLAGGIAHDFNNLLTVMLTTASAIGRRVEPDSPLRPYVGDLCHAARRASDLTRDLLAFSRRQVMQARPLQLNQIVAEMEGLLRRTLGASVQLEVELAPDLPLIHADQSRLDQVIMNLALNARDAMPEGGTLTLRTGRCGTGAGDPDEAAPPGLWVTLAVIDTGTGMDERTRAQVFEPFFSTKEAGAGTGLGLSTAYGIVAQSGGHITVTSEPGRGSAFVVYLPPTDDRPTPTPRPRAATPELAVPAGQPVVLLVDDIDEVRTSLGEYLRAAGFEVRLARSAEHALAEHGDRLDELDVVVTDIVMPGRSGIDLAVELLRRRPDLPVALMSGDVRHHDQRRLPEHVGLLQKPFSGDELVRLLVDLVDGDVDDGAQE